MLRDVWTDEKLEHLRMYVENGFPQEHIKFLFNVDDEQLKEGLRKIEEGAA